MPPTERTTLPCPQCQQPVEVEIWQLLDLGRQPELRRRFLQGQLNALHCTNCGAAGMLAVPLVVHDPANEQVIFFIPDDPQITPDLFQQIQRESGHLLMESLPGRPPDYIFSPTLCRDPAELAARLADGQPPAEAETAAEMPPELARLLAVLTPAQREVFLSILQNTADEESFNRELAKHPDLLAALRQTAPPAPPAELQAIMQALSQPARRSDMPQRVELCRQALALVSRDQNPPLWAALQVELGNSLAQNPLDSRAENIEQAIAAYQGALEVMTRQAMPVEWATAMMNLATAYSDRIRGERAENIEQAIAAYQGALEVMTRQAMPVEWATAMMNLATAYSDRIRGERAENIEQAIAAYQQALTIQTIIQFPVDHQKTQRNLANLYFGERRWTEAVAAYQAAIAAGQLLLATAYTESGRQAEVAETAQLYAGAAYCRLRLGQPGEALLMLEQGKTRLLAETLALTGADLSGLPEAQQHQVTAVREAIRSLAAEMRLPPDTPGRRSDRELAQALQQARAGLTQLIDTIRRDQPDFMPAGLDLPKLLALIPTDGALMAPLVTSQGSAVFVIPYGVTTVEAEHVLWLDNFSDGDLQTILREPAKAPVWGGWLGAYFDFLANRTLATFATWQAAIETWSHVLWDGLLQPVYERLERLGLAPGAAVLLIPQGGLGLLPLHAAWREVNGQKRSFLDDFAITYAPSGYALSVSQRRLQEEQRRQRSLLAVINPTQDLTYTPVEGEAVVALFDTQAVKALIGNAATPASVQQEVVGRSYLHFSCHGFYNWRDAMRSGLVLAGGQSLTLAQIISDLNLDTARLVTLSACETGLTEFRQSPDEYLGLPAGFLQAGAPGVISTLWAVDDLSTMLLMEKFYRLHLQDGLEIAAALRQAQLWLRDVTAAELSERFSGERQVLLGGTRMPAEVINQEYRRFAKLKSGERPFAHPYYWAAFTFSGA